MSQDSWVSCEYELPMKDGFYEVTNHPLRDTFGQCWYDGYGFLFENIYRNPKYWREIERKEKRYGKIND
jgi:hypothetical protein